MAERYIIGTRSNGYCGCDETEYLIFPENTTDSEINAYFDEGMYDYAESCVYGCALQWDEDWESEEDEEMYFENCEYEWHEATEEEKEDYADEFERF